MQASMLSERREDQLTATRKQASRGRGADPPTASTQHQQQTDRQARSEAEAEGDEAEATEERGRTEKGEEKGEGEKGIRDWSPRVVSVFWTEAAPRERAPSASRQVPVAYEANSGAKASFCYKTGPRQGSTSGRPRQGKLAQQRRLERAVGARFTERRPNVARRTRVRGVRGG